MLRCVLLPLPALALVLTIAVTQAVPSGGCSLSHYLIQPWPFCCLQTLTINRPVHTIWALSK